MVERIVRKWRDMRRIVVLSARIMLFITSEVEKWTKAYRKGIVKHGSGI